MATSYSALAQISNFILRTLTPNSVLKLTIYKIRLVLVLVICMSIAKISTGSAQDIENTYKSQSALAPRIYAKGKGKWGTVLGGREEMMSVVNQAHAKKDPQLMAALGIAPRLYENRRKLLVTVPPRLHPPKTSPINAFCEFGRPLHQRCGYKDGPCPRFYKCDIERGWEDYGFCCPRTDICMDNSIALGIKCGFGVNCPPNFFCTISRFGGNFTGICCPSKKPGFCPPLNTTTATVNPNQPIIILLSSSNICRTSCSSDFDCPGTQKCCDDATGCMVCVERNLFDVRIDLRVGVLNVSISQPSLFPTGDASITAGSVGAARFGPLGVRQALIARARIIAQRQVMARARVEQKKRIAAQRKLAELEVKKRAELEERKKVEILLKRQLPVSLSNEAGTNNLNSKADTPLNISSKMTERGVSANANVPIQTQLNELAQAKARLMALSSLLGLTGTDSLNSLSNQEKLNRMNSLNHLLFPFLAPASNNLNSPLKSQSSYKTAKSNAHPNTKRANPFSKIDVGKVAPKLLTSDFKVNPKKINNIHQNNVNVNHVSADHDKDDIKGVAKFVRTSSYVGAINKGLVITPRKYTIKRDITHARKHVKSSDINASSSVNNKNSNPFNLNSPVAVFGSI
ncbi:unnamed protein product [Gordionus sp. m RMFG-2023]